MDKLRKSLFRSITVCGFCKHTMSEAYATLFLGGACPHCGGKHMWYFTHTRKVIYREVYHHKWYQIFGRKTTYEGANEFSEQWLIENTNHFLT